MLNKVVFHTARVLNHDLHLATLRFNFRGVGDSEGEFDEGRGEQDDLAAAWEEARRLVPDGPLVAAGFSFGAAMTLALASRRDDPAALALVGLPFRLFEPPDPFPRSLPLAAVHGERDQFTPPERVAAYLETWPGPNAWRVVPEADHFLYDDLPEAIGFLAENVGAWLGLPGDA
jgi:alpha/beta superfamily hydrolase